MSDNFHAVLTPQVLDSPKHQVTIAFDSPSEATNVVLQLFEVDAWTSTSGDVNEGGRDTLIAEFSGKIVNGKFVLERKNPQGPMGGSPSLLVHLDGETEKPNFVVHDLPIPPSALPNEQGIYEIELRVTGKIKGKTKSYRTPNPVFVRNFKAGRPVAAFVTGGGQDPFFIAARSYWFEYADGLFERGSVEGIREFIRTETDRRGYGPWGEINIVNHANEFQWIIRLFANDQNVRRLGIKEIKEAQNDIRFQAALRTQLDEQSKVVIRGCVLGNDQPILDEIRKLFGGKAMLFAPKYVQAYSTQNGIPRESFWEQFFFYGPGAQAPPNATCKQRLASKYPTPKVKDDDWMPMLTSTNPLVRHDNMETFTLDYTFTFTHDAKKPTPQRDGETHNFLADARGDWKNDEDHFHTDFDDWQWSQGPLQRHEISRTETQFARHLVGQRFRVEVRRELKDANGQPVRPDLNNQQHYGRSPAW